ncbi:hypothetical protein HMSSN139_48790 [Paenibacillus sp. HMSSN-139]|nr:hypothetical protein HMSSN139_48790 [Paenibacillus sp. HMSSN-139]
MSTLLEIDRLSTHFKTEEGRIKAVDEVSLRIKPGETVCIVGGVGLRQKRDGDVGDGLIAGRCRRRNRRPDPVWGTELLSLDKTICAPSAAMKSR